MKMIVKDHPNLVRDSQSKAIISEDRNSYEAYVKERKLRTAISDVIGDVDGLKKDITEIKSMLQIIVSNTNDK